jgi:hypothetical protein
MSKSGPETLLVDRIRKAIYAEWPDAWTLKVAGGRYQTGGIPDLIVVVKGRMIGLEVKKKGVSESEQHARARATEIQLATIDKLRKAGAVAGVVLTIAEALDQVREAIIDYP